MWPTLPLAPLKWWWGPQLYPAPSPALTPSFRGSYKYSQGLKYLLDDSLFISDFLHRYIQACLSAPALWGCPHLARPLGTCSAWVLTPPQAAGRVWHPCPWGGPHFPVSGPCNPPQAPRVSRTQGSLDLCMRVVLWGWASMLGPPSLKQPDPHHVTPVSSSCVSVPR